MSQSQSNSSRVAKSESSDLLINLPDDLRQKILGFLRLQDAIRTSTLSTHWRHEWAKLPHIRFDLFLLNRVLEGVEESHMLTTYSNVVNNVLASHLGPLHRLVLYNFLGKKDGLNIDHCLKFVSRKTIRDLSLIGFEHELPSMVFTYTELRSLRLAKFRISTLPQTFSGFRHLTTLSLSTSKSQMSEVLENIIHRCPQLRHLHLQCLNPATHLTIHAPKLKWLYIEGYYEKLCLGNETTNITKLFLGVLEVNHLRRFLSAGSLPVLEHLRLGPGIFLIPMFHKHLGDQGMIDYLRRLQPQTLELLGVPFQCPFLNYCVVKLLNIAPSLQRLHCKVLDDNICSCEITPHISCCGHWDVKKADVSSLKYVKVFDVWRGKNVIAFIKFILECAPVLELMTIMLNCQRMEGDDEMNIISELKQCSRASKNVRIILNGVKLHETRE